MTEKRSECNGFTFIARHFPLELSKMDIHKSGKTELNRKPENCQCQDYELRIIFIYRYPKGTTKQQQQLFLSSAKRVYVQRINLCLDRHNQPPTHSQCYFNGELMLETSFKYLNNLQGNFIYLIFVLSLLKCIQCFLCLFLCVHSVCMDALALLSFSVLFSVLTHVCKL